MFDMTQFNGVRSAAANLSRGESPYTRDMFLADFPQFADKKGAFIGPASILDGFIANAASAISPGRWFERWRYACGLHVAHYATLYLRTYAPCAASPAQAAATGALVGVVKSATLGDSSVSYDTEAVVKGTEKWGGLNATQYGQLLATEARLVGMGGATVL